VSIDLHIHSENSDGTESIKDIVEQSKNLQLEAISITDHEYLSKVPKDSGIKIISGVEVSASWKKLETENKFAGIHLLMYFLDENSELNLELKEIREQKNLRNLEIIDLLEKQNIFIDKSKFKNLKTKVPGRPHIANAMVEQGYVDSVNEAFLNYLGNGKSSYVSTHQVSINTLFELCKSTKVLTFLAHPHTLMSNESFSKNENWINHKFKELLLDLKKLGLHGIEAYYPGYNHATIDKLLKIANEYNFLVSGGSDFHGSIKPNNNLGIGYENNPLKIPKEVLSKLEEQYAKL